MSPSPVKKIVSCSPYQHCFPVALPLHCYALQLFAGVLAERANMSLPDLTMMMVRVADAKIVERFREAVLNRAGDLD